MGTIKRTHKDGSITYTDDSLTKEQLADLDREMAEFEKEENNISLEGLSEKEKEEIKKARQTFYERQLVLGAPLNPKMDNYWLTEDEKKRLANGEKMYLK
jgi:hypothetical protein